MLTPIVAAVLLVALPAAPSATAQEAGDPERGQDVYEQRCSMCHGDDAEGMPDMHPSLRGATDRLTREGVEVAIRKGREVTPPMPAFEDRLTDDEIAEVIAYIDSLPAGPRNPDGGMMGGDGMGGGMGNMMDGGETMMWVVIVVLAAVVAGLGGYLLARRRG